jgi:hypothetical protein
MLGKMNKFDKIESMTIKTIKPKFNIPNRKYSKKPKKMVSWRLNSDLVDKLDKVAIKVGMNNTTELVSLLLDQGVCWIEDKNLKK